MPQNLKAVEQVEALTPEENIPIAKPSEFSLDKFKAKRTATVANVETLPSALPIHNMAAAKDFVRLHPNEAEYWSAELCFVDVPIKGQKHNTLHLIDEDLALQYLRGRRNQALPPRARGQAATTYSSFATSRRKIRDNSWNDDELGGVRKSQDALDARPPAGRRRASKATKSRSRATRTPSLRRTGRRNRSANSSARLRRTLDRERGPPRRYCAMIGEKQPLS